MSARKWKPGDVAMVRRGGKEVVAMRYHTGSEGGWRWQQAAGLAFDHFDADEDTTPRPLVVLDPEDREQVARLADAFCDARWSHLPDSDECDPLTRSSMQAALREFANPTPPKPEEPTEMSARVIDRDGLAWANHDGDWLPLGSGKFGRMPWDYLVEQRGPLEVQS